MKQFFIQFCKIIGVATVVVILSVTFVYLWSFGARLIPMVALRHLRSSAW